MSNIETLSIDLLRLDGDTQSRIEVNGETIDDYAELITASSKGKWPFGPLTVYHDGSSYFVADGFHRTLAAINAGRASVPCAVVKGTARDARIHGMTANDQHGLRMSREDRRNNVVWLLEKFPDMTQEDIAKKSGSGLRTVHRIAGEKKNVNAPMAHLGVAETLGKPSKDAEKAAKAKAKADAATAKQKEKEAAAVAKEKVKEDAKAARAAAKAKAKADALAALPKDEQQKLNRSLAQKYIDAAVRAVDDLHRVKPNQTKRMAAIKMLQGVELW